MKTFLSIPFIVVLYLISACTASSDKTLLSATEFSEKLEANKISGSLIDVRTPEEFEQGHIENAKNFDWNGGQFEQQVSKLDKNSPVFVYCLSGGRSAEAAEKLRMDGFKTVYELDGGIMAWRNSSLPETEAKHKVLSSLTKTQYDEMLNTDKLVLVDFYATWCAPCKKMNPILKEIASEMKDKLILIRINTDENQDLAQELNIQALPTLVLYKNKEVTWENIGFIEKEKIIAQLNSQAK